MDRQLQKLEYGDSGEMGNEKITPSISINKDVWNEFCSIIVKKYGNRQVSNILEELIKDYIKRNS